MLIGISRTKKQLEKPVHSPADTGQSIVLQYLKMALHYKKLLNYF